MSDGLVCLLGIAIVFIGLVCIVLIVELMHRFVGNKQRTPVNKEPEPLAVPKADSTVIENRSELIAAVSAALAEELGTDVSAIRIHSFKKI